MTRRISHQVSRQAARYFLAEHEPLAGLVRQHGPCPLYRGRADAFETLASSIINQQLSVQAGQTIEARVLAVTGEPRLSADGLLGVSAKALRSAGLSGNKVRFLHALAEAAGAGDFNPRSLAQLPDDEVTTRLVALPGIGPWTAQMFLMFALRRADVFSPDDVALQRATAELYRMRTRPNATRLARMATRWKPYRTIAAWYLWQHVD